MKVQEPGGVVKWVVLQGVRLLFTDGISAGNATLFPPAPVLSPIVYIDASTQADGESPPPTNGEAAFMILSLLNLSRGFAWMLKEFLSLPFPRLAEYTGGSMSWCLQDKPIHRVRCRQAA